MTTAEIRLGQRSDRVSAVGSGRAVRSLTVAAQVGGIVGEVAFRPGQRVEAKDPLVVLENEAERISVDRAAAARDQAKATVDRYEVLARTSAVSTAQLEQARTDLAVAEADLAAARHALEQRTIRAPFGGIMGLTTLTAGDYLATGASIATIDDRSTLVIEFTIPEAAAGSVELGQPVRAALVSRPGDVFAGTISAIDSRLDPTSRSLSVEAEVPNADGRLIPGSTFSVELRIEGGDAPAVPGLAIQWDRNGAYVWRLKPDRAVERVSIAILERGGSAVLVDAELSPGDLIVHEGGDQVRTGQTVAPVGDAAAEQPTELSARQAGEVDGRIH
ncbi:efflux transporter, RND family, MFP subunit [Lutibaculum baratangense AMV1]|uniref:Efflux transporter, RND family, MFP subunit n=1 Tax=Lutibaculum baratangense AMV1 TaxID=631454 RepID=V4QXV9_9HYPH|nr:efflux transporter, RND family, MFP subunit [Lutibaculum baratangense AMV1]